MLIHWRVPTLTTGCVSAGSDRGSRRVEENIGLMSYAQRKEISGNRTAAIVIVAILHAILGYAIVTGLAYNVIKKAAEDLKTFDVEEEPPPPEEAPPPPKDMPKVLPPPVT